MPKRDIEELMVLPNIMEVLTDEESSVIGNLVVEGFNDDLDSMSDWLDEAEASLEQAMLIPKEKNHPWPGAANVKYPLIAQSSLQFSALTAPEIIRNDRVVEAHTVGEDPDGRKEQRAKRIAQHMSYQLLIEDDSWSIGLDKLLPMLSIVGTVHKKTWFNPIDKKNVSELCSYDSFVINNMVESLPKARRATHILRKHKNEIMENIRAGLYKLDNLEILFPKMDDDSEPIVHDLRDEFQELLEQHCYMDLDGDGYEEPYVITVHKATQTVLRIVARFDPEGITRNDSGEIVRIRPVQYFTDYHFLPSPDGSYFSMGFGKLLKPLNETINTTINQLLDSGTLANLQGGFVGKGLRLKGGELRLQPGEWKKIDMGVGTDIKNNIVPIPYKEPSLVLFQLLGSMVEAGKQLSSVTDIALGQQDAQNAPATSILALVEQGLKVFTSIQRRIHRSLKKEFEKLYRLNRLFLDPETYFRTMDSQSAILREDYEDASMDVHPVSDPNLSSDAQRLARTQALLALVGTPGVNGREIIKRYLEDLNTPNLEKILPPVDPNAPPPIDLIEKQSEIQERADKHAIETQKLQIEAAKVMAEIEKMKAEALKAIAEAEAAEPGRQLDMYKSELKAVTDIAKAKITGDRRNEQTNNQTPEG